MTDKTTNAFTFCDVPFREIHTNPNGDVRVCCYVVQPIGNFKSDTLENIWRSPFANKVRESILNQTYSHCDKRMCPIAARATPDALQAEHAQAEEARHRREFMDVLEIQRIAFQHDESCNLSCPSCRLEMLYASEQRQAQMIAIQDEWLAGSILRDAKRVTASANGDPFASKIYMDLLSKISQEKLPDLELSFLTNGILLTPARWESLSNLHYAVRTILVSIDAATADTYNVVRRGGSFAKLMQNMEFVAELRRSGAIKSFCIKFVIAARNFREMPAFIRLGKSLGCDRVKFQYIDKFSHINAREYNDMAVHHIQHPQHAELLDVLTDPIFDDPIVHMMNPNAVGNEDYVDQAEDAFATFENLDPEETAATLAKIAATKAAARVAVETLNNKRAQEVARVEEEMLAAKAAARAEAEAAALASRPRRIDRLKQLVLRNVPDPLVWVMRAPYRALVGRAPFAPPNRGASADSIGKQDAAS